MKVENHMASVKVIHGGTEKIIFAWFDDSLKAKVWHSRSYRHNAEAYFILIVLWKQDGRNCIPSTLNIGFLKKGEK